MISCKLTSNREYESTSYKRRIHIQAFSLFQSIGFDEQFAAFIYYMLDLGYEDSIHYECDDDFVIDRVRDGFIIKEYYQVKHSKYKDAK